MRKEIEEILIDNMTDNGYKFWKAIEAKTPTVWHRPSSSTGKYHKKHDGSVQTVGEHTEEMVYACSKAMRSFNVFPKTPEADVLFLAVLCHDLFKFGIGDPLYKKHTEKKHDKIIGNTILANKDKFLKILNESQIRKLEEMTRYHSGRWSTDAPKNFDFKNYHPETLFVHLLDMLSTNNCLKLPWV